MFIIIELFQIYQVFYFSVVFLLGLIVGSFLNVVILRLPIMIKREWHSECCQLLNIKPQKTERFNLITPLSQCPHCQHRITALENIPVISYLLLKGRCRTCQHKISMRYPIIEILTGIATIIAAAKFGVTEKAFFAMLLSWALIALSAIDLDHQLLPDKITLPFLWLGIIINFYFQAPTAFTVLADSILGVILGYGSLWSIYMLFKLLTGKEGMGYGDFKLLAVLGAWLGWKMLPLIIVISSFIGAVIGIILILFKAHHKNKPIPFGPYLSIAGWIAMLWGPTITSSYLTMVT